MGTTATMKNIPLCPRCHFRLAPNAHICRTCGYNFSVKKEAAPAPAPAVPTGKPPVQNVWTNVFKITQQDMKTEQRHDEPALGEG
jgi:ribosomal protein L40E